ncbi:hypothetical protein Scep_013080 [Stephania cephalantha]|uniref:Chlororespiratory reduction 41 n=1 Tax=Stephania cephalantha TaxID=152367 RepID=A0AAP0P728_9MAGN
MALASSAVLYLKPLKNNSFITTHSLFYPFKFKTTTEQSSIVIKCENSNNSTAGHEIESENQEQQQEEQEEQEEQSRNGGFQIRKVRKSEIIRDRKSRAGMVKPEPPNLEIGWKRTKEIVVEKPKGYVIADFLEKLEGLMERGDYGSAELLEKAGEIVAERAREEAEDLMDDGEVEERLVTELVRVLRLMEMDLAMVKAAVKDETVKERLEQAKARCRQAILKFSYVDGGLWNHGREAEGGREVAGREAVGRPVARQRALARQRV